jgi:riboflavin-specific deaminase-like protein
MPKLGLLPSVTLKWAQTIDGQLADDLDQSQWISGKEERIYTHELRSRHQAVLVGAQTFLKDRCQLTVRNFAIHGPQPSRIIMDPRNRVLRAASLDHEIVAALNAGDRRTYILTDVVDDETELELGESVAVVRYRYDEFNRWLVGSLSQLALVFEINESRALKELMVEGGAHTLAAFLKFGLVDHLEVAISPLILGGQRHRVSTGGLLQNADRFEIESQQQLGSDVLLRYKIRHAEVAQRRIS